MAIIGNINKLETFLNDKNLEDVFNYFKQAINSKSDIHKEEFLIFLLVLLKKL